MRLATLTLSLALCVVGLAALFLSGFYPSSPVTSADISRGNELCNQRGGVKTLLRVSKENSKVRVQCEDGSFLDVWDKGA